MSNFRARRGTGASGGTSGSAPVRISTPTLDAAGKARFAEKLRRMTPGAEQLIRDWNLEEK